MMRHAASVLCALVLSACGSADPTLYTLSACAGAKVVNEAAGGLVLLRATGVPHYLRREQIVYRKGGDQVVAAPNDWWAEPLQSGVERVLAADLAGMLPSARLTTGAEPMTPAALVSVAVALDRFEADAGTGTVVLRGAARLQSAGRSMLVSLRADQPVEARDYAGRVSAMDGALCTVAGALAAPIGTLLDEPPTPLAAR